MIVNRFKHLNFTCLVFFILGGIPSFSSSASAADCEDVDGTAETISADCQNLSITGDSPNVTIDSGVTIDSTAANAVATPDATNAIITNNGTISAATNRGFRTSGGDVQELINNGTITAAGGNQAIRSNSNITTLTNAGTISADGKYAIHNRGSGTIGTLNNSGTISAGDDFAIRNDGSITTLTNTDTISANEDSSIWNGGTITTLTNSDTGTISAVDEFGLKNVNGTIGTLNNSGTITAGDRYGLFNDQSSSNTSTITTLTNSGTISSDRSGLWNDGTITTLTNSGNIKALTGDFGLKNVNGTIVTLTNSGTISAGDDYGLYNDGTATITTLTNTGTISAAGNGISIWNDSTATFTTLNNSQGASSSALTFKGKLPTNYNVIVNSAADYGKITFSSVSGTLNFGVHSTSTLAEDTTYSSVLSGLSSSEIGSGTSGTFVSGSDRHDWTLENSSGNLWDLVVAAGQDITPDTNTSVATSVKPNVVLGINSLSSVTEVNFANMNTYDCDLFGEDGVCMSIGGRYTAINTPETQTSSLVFVGGYKLSDTLRVAGFFHRNLKHNTPASFRLSDKTPMVGALVVWNQNPNKLGYQLKLANAFQRKNAYFTREVVGASEEGKGKTTLEAKSYVAELLYSYQINNDTVLSPYLAARRALIQQRAYSETGVTSPLTFNKIADKSTTLLLGLKFNTALSSNLSLKGSLGVEHDINHSVDKLEPTGISGLTTVSLDNSFNRTRPVVSAGFDYELKSNQRISSIFQYQELPYQAKTESNVYINYTIGF